MEFPPAEYDESGSASLTRFCIQLRVFCARHNSGHNGSASINYKFPKVKSFGHKIPNNVGLSPSYSFVCHLGYISRNSSVFRGSYTVARWRQCSSGVLASIEVHARRASIVCHVPATFCRSSLHSESKKKVHVNWFFSRRGRSRFHGVSLSCVAGLALGVPNFYRTSRVSTCHMSLLLLVQFCHGESGHKSNRQQVD